MTEQKKKILLTGASGSMGNAAFLELMTRPDRPDMVLLVRPSAVNKKKFVAYEGGKSTPAGPEEHRRARRSQDRMG